MLLRKLQNTRKQLNRSTLQHFRAKCTQRPMASTTNVVVERSAPDKVAPGGVHPSPRGFATHKKIIVLIAVLILVGSLVAAYIRISPFAQQAVIQDLQDASGSTVTIRSYR